jgi:SAM-dependent methyltransferase
MSAPTMPTLATTATAATAVAATAVAAATPAASVPPPAVDFGKAAADYARHRQGFPPRFYRELAAHGVGLAGQRIVDLGTGTGTVARALAARGCDVTGVDVSAPLLAQAAALAAADGVALALRHAPAEATGLPEHAFDAVIAALCWHWFDRPRAAAEARRLLADRPDATIAIAHLDWIRDGGVVEDTVALIEAHRGAPIPVTVPDNAGFYPWWPVDLRAAGFTDLTYAGFDHELVYSHEAWRGRIRASAGVGATMTPDAVRRFDDALAALLAARYPDPVPTLHRVFWIVARRPHAPHATSDPATATVRSPP